MIQHDWKLTSFTTPSGKAVYQCTICKLMDIAPVVNEFESRPCEADKYADKFGVQDGKIYIIPKSLMSVLGKPENEDGN